MTLGDAAREVLHVVGLGRRIELRIRAGNDLDAELLELVRRSGVDGVVPRTRTGPEMRRLEAAGANLGDLIGAQGESGGRHRGVAVRVRLGCLQVEVDRSVEVRGRRAHALGHGGQAADGRERNKNRPPGPLNRI